MLFIKQKYLPYAIAFFSVGVTLLVKLGLEDVTGITSSFSLWLIAISISTWYGSIISGLTSVFLAALASHYFFTNPSSTLDSLEFVLFVIEGLLISALTANFQSSKQQSDSDKTEARINLLDLLQSQRSLRQGEELYRTLTQNLPNGVVFLFDRDMRFMGAEGTELQIFGLPKEEFQGKTLHETVLPETYELIEPTYRSTLQGTPMCIEIPYNNQVYLVQTFPVKDENSKILTGLAIFQNVTNRKQAEAKIIKLNQALNRRVKELQTLLEVIPTGIGIAEDPECQTIRANPALAKLLGIPVDANASLSAPNDERPTNFKVYQDGRELAPEELAMQYATTHGVEILDSEIEVVRDDGVRINLSQYAAPLFDEDGKVRGCVSIFLDITQRNQADLLSNAIKFSSKNESVEVSLEEVESQAQITVIDRGRGIEAEFIPFVFERFSQRDASTTRSAGGLGLGLAIALTIVELHNGNITAASAGFGKGSTFTVRLPIVTMTTQLSNKELVVAELLHGNQKITQLQNLCILVVDDDADARMLMQTVLQSAGADVLVAASVKEALALLEQQSPALLISDISMPDEDGFTLIRQVRSRTMEKGGQIPAIALTAFAEAKNEQRILKAGFQLFITKPIEPMELVDKVVETLKT
jgi:PAS domain S-box-containing protein